jgi:uncharacterized membrane protein
MPVEDKNRTVAIVLGCVWMLMLVILSFLPNHDKLLLHTTGHYHRIGHILGFLTATLLLVSSVKSLRAQFALAALLVSFGYLLEFLEHVIYNGALERSDVLIDTFGVILGLVIVLAREEYNRVRRFE